MIKSHSFSKLFICLLFIPYILFSQPPNISYQSISDLIPTDKNVKIGKLNNGITYYIRENKKPEKHVELRIVFKVGAILEDDDQNGLAHFTEHMLFNGTKHFPKNELINVLRNSGIRFGADINASTGTDVTFYMLPIPSDRDTLLETCFQILQDWAFYANMNGEDIDNERGVIISEWRQRNNAQTRLFELHFSKILQNSKYAKRNVIGDTNTLRTFPYDAIRRFYKDWYRPDLMAIIVVGDLPQEKSLALINKYFSNIEPRQNPRERPKYSVPANDKPIISIATDKEMPMGMALIAYKKPEQVIKTIGDYKNYITRGLYDMMFNQRLAEVSRQPKPPFMRASGGMGEFIGNVYAYSLQVICKPDGLVNALEALYTEVYRCYQHGFTESELARAKQDYITKLEKAYNEKDKTQSSAFADEYMRNFTDDEFIPGIEFEYGMSSKLINEITLADVNKLSSEYITKDNLVIAISGPDKDLDKLPTESKVISLIDSISRSNIAAYIDKKTDKPLFKYKVKEGSIVEEKEIKELGITVLTLSNGAKVYLKPTDFQNDEVTFTAFSPGGTSLVNDQDYLSAMYTSTIIDNSGIDEFTLDELVKLLSGKNVDVFPYINNYNEGISGSSSIKDIETMFQLLHLSFTHPRKDTQAFSSLMTKLIDRIRNDSLNPEASFRDTLNVTLTQYHYRTRPIREDMLKDIDLDKVYDIYKDRFGDAGNFTFIFVGNFEINAIKTLITKYIASLPTNNRKETWKDVGIRTPKGKIEKKVIKGTHDKAHVRLVYSGEFEWSPENRYYISSLVDILRNKILDIVREEKSGIYSPGVFQSTTKYPNSEYQIHIDFVCEPKRVDELVKTVIDIIEDMKKNISNEDIKKVVEAQKIQYEKNLKENGFWVSYLYNTLSNNDKLTSILDYLKFVNGLTKGKMERSANMYFGVNCVEVVLYPEKY